MARKLYSCVSNTAAGWVGILSSTGGLRRIILPRKSAREVRDLLGSSAAPAPDDATDLAKRFQAYFSGRRADFPDRLDLSGATPFQRQVWRAARLIPYGQTRSYRWVASQIGQPGAARAVGQALGKNPLPVVIPCHRVVASDGSLGGYSEGIEMKKFLLELEKIPLP
jgi:methylated-DNA-[protein]-cysteine S-methyltransferase